jgi:uncharacterized protein YacL
VPYHDPPLAPPLVPPVVEQRWPRWAIVVLGGLILGSTDLLFATLFWRIGHGVSATRVMQSVARGVLGTASFEGGVPTALLGAVLHYTIALAMAASYYFVSRKLRVLTRRPVACGLAYGVLLYLIMNLIVLPLSAAGMPKFDNVVWVALSVIMHAVFGLICAFTARRAA